MTTTAASRTRRRLTFQLTPLLDLLLIVIFAQYMEVRDSQIHANQQQAAQRHQLQQEFDRRLKALDTDRKLAVQEIESQRQTLQTQREQYAQQFENIVDQHQRAGTTLAEAFNLPGKALEQILSLQNAGNPEEARRLQEAAASLKEMLDLRGERFIQFLLRVDEMQKHVTVWEIHIQDNGRALLTDGSQQAIVSFETPDEFITRTFEAGKAMPEPRTLVILLVSHGDAQARFRRIAMDSMPTLAEKFRTASGNTHWYDFSPLGFRPGGPLFFQGPEIQPRKP